MDLNQDNMIFLQEAKKAVLDLKQASMIAEEQELQAKRLSKSLAAEKKAVADSIDITVRKRKSEITESYDIQIEKTQGQLKKARATREKAKTQGVKERMTEETSEIQETNRKLSTEIKTLFRQERVPGFCNSLFFYALYYTRGFKEMFVFVLTLAFCFLAVPVGIYYLIGIHETYALISVYLVDIILFGGIYLIVNNKVKVHHHQALKQGRQIRNAMAANRRKMKAIKNSIKKDKNEEMYDLDDYDAEIIKLEDEKIDIANQKQEALTNFENSGKVLIAKEITDNNFERISQLEMESNKANQLLTEIQSQVKALSMMITEKYEPMLGKEFLQEDKIDKLVEAFTNGHAVNITEAREVVLSGRTFAENSQPTESDAGNEG